MKSSRFVTIVALALTMPVAAAAQTATASGQPRAPFTEVFGDGDCGTELAGAVKAIQAGRTFNDPGTLTICAAKVGLSPSVQRVETEIAQAVENARTKQVTAPATASGSTTVAERAALPRLLAIAIEHGAIDKAVDGTTLTLTGSPYALAAALADGGDSPQTYQDYRVLNHIAVAASFDIGQNTDPLAAVDTDQLTDLSFRVLLTHDRSGRSKSFDARFRELVMPSLKAQAAETSDIDKQVFGTKAVQALRDAVFNDLDSLAKAAAAIPPSADAAQANVLDILERDVVQPIRAGQVTLTQAQREAIAVAPGRLTALASRLAMAEADIGRFVRTLGEMPEFTASFFTHRTGGTLEYSGGRGAYDQWIGKVELTGNGAATFYDTPDPARNQKKFRDVTGAFTLAAFRGEISPTANPPTVFSFSARYQYLPETRGTSKPHKALAQVKVELPVSKGVTVPLSVTFASSPSLLAGKEKTIRGQIGFTVDLDKLSALK